MKLYRSITISIFALLGTIVLGINSAQAETLPSFPLAFWGNVTINGSPAPVGTIVRAYYGDVLGGQATVNETGLYGYNDPTKQKLLVGEGSGAITFKFRSASFNSGAGTAGNSAETYAGFESGKVVNKNLAFTVTIPTPPPSGGGGGGGGGGGFGGGNSGSGSGNNSNPGNTTNPGNTGNHPNNGQRVGQVLGESTTTPHSNGTLILDGTTVYLISNNKKSGFRNEAEYRSYGFDFSLMEQATEGDKQLPDGPILKAMDGTLVLDASDNRTVYVIGAGGVKRGFVSETVFKKLGYKYTQAVKINLSDYPAGQPIGSYTEAHPDGSLILEGKTVWWINNGKKYGFATMDIFNSYGWTLAKLVPANVGDSNLIQGDVLKPRSEAMKLGIWLQ